MPFDSVVYFVFLSIIVLLYWNIKHRSQNWLLLTASYFFYGWWDWRFLGLIGASTTIDFLIARWIHETNNRDKRRTLLILSLVMNFTFLGFFKYFNFFSDSLLGLLHNFGFSSEGTSTLIRIALPPAISFYTFQEIAYIVDVYNNKINASRNFIEYAVFISLFPHLIAGPIQRPGHLLPQVQNPRNWDASRFFDGLALIIEGLFRKCVVANNCALVANGVFQGKFGEMSFVTVLLGTYAFAFQIYADFSAYSCIARGSAQVLGFHFMVNFRQPYFSLSIQEFWRRWHISLSTWLRDYLYIGLGGNRNGEIKTYRNLFLTMLLGGLWHGANWTFVLWGAIHGSALAIERKIFGKSKGLKTEEKNPFVKIGKIFAIFNIVCISWIFFRATTINQGFNILLGLFHWQWRNQYLTAFTFLCIFIAPLILIDLRLEKADEEYFYQKSPIPSRIAMLAVLFGVVSVLGGIDPSAFLYFQF